MNTFFGAYNTVLATFQNINIFGAKKGEVEGYLMYSDNTNNKTLLLVKENEKSWKTKWFNNEENNFTVPKEPLSKIFKN